MEPEIACPQMDRTAMRRMTARREERSKNTPGRAASTVSRPTRTIPHFIEDPDRLGVFLQNAKNTRLDAGLRCLLVSRERAMRDQADTRIEEVEEARLAVLEA